MWKICSSICYFPKYIEFGELYSVSKTIFINLFQIYIQDLKCEIPLRQNRIPSPLNGAFAFSPCAFPSPKTNIRPTLRSQKTKSSKKRFCLTSASPSSPPAQRVLHNQWARIRRPIQVSLVFAVTHHVVPPVHIEVLPYIRSFVPERERDVFVVFVVGLGECIRWMSHFVGILPRFYLFAREEVPAFSVGACGSVCHSSPNGHFFQRPRQISARENIHNNNFARRRHVS